MAVKKPHEPVWNEKAGTWEVDFYVEGKRIRRRLGIRSQSMKAAARKKAEQLFKAAYEQVHFAQPDRRPTEGTTFFKAAESYVKGGGEKRFLPRIMKYFGPDTVVEEIDDMMITKAEITLYPQATPQTRHRQVRVPVMAVKRYALGLRRRKSTDVRRTRWLQPEEMEKLIEVASNPLENGLRDPNLATLAKIAFMIGSGCGPGETCAVNVEHFNHATRQCWIPAVEVGAGKTQARQRWVRLPPRAIELMGRLPEAGRAFRAPDGSEYTLRKNGGGQFQHAFNKLRDAAGLSVDVKPYTLRHTWATWFYAQTKDFGSLLDHGGWNKADTANRYRKIAPDDLPERLIKHGWDFTPNLDLSHYHDGKDVT